MRVVFTNDPSVNGLLKSGLSVKIADRVEIVSDPKKLSDLESGDVVIFTEDKDGRTTVRCVGTVTGKIANVPAERVCIDFSDGC